MALARHGWDGSDVHVTAHAPGRYSCADRHHTFEGDAAQMAAHLADHERDDGYRVPPDVYERLAADRRP
jgi:hypothetical protein